jgi:hypothetical protein
MAVNLKHVIQRLKHRCAGRPAKPPQRDRSIAESRTFGDITGTTHARDVEATIEHEPVLHHACTVQPTVKGHSRGSVGTSGLVPAGAESSDDSSGSFVTCKPGNRRIIASAYLSARAGSAR